ncbi:hypothetical protein [Salinibacter altiplanensis]|uniref:hypothetical protein n=1 Tax=Salinibacter altiplanensis TaxID=1803181 RepID=UPI000C9EC7DC|nr:hypothetical protein [Salinibacter altiplanensis]
MSLSYRLHGLRLRAASDDAGIQNLLRRTLRYKGAEPHSADEPADLTLSFCVGRPPLDRPRAARHVGTSARCGIEVWNAPEHMVLRHEDATVAVRLETGRADGTVRPALLDARTQKARDPLFHLVVLSLGLLCRHRGWFPLHAAALAHDGRGLLCPARSGQGKTTVALSLLRNGWAHVSDDTVLLREEEGRAVAHSFRGPVCVGPEAMEHFPELMGPDWPASLSNSAKWAVDAEQISLGPSRPACTPRLLVLPEIDGGPDSHVESIGPKPALDQLLAQGAFFLSPTPRIADRHLTVLRRLVEQTRAYRFRAGHDVLEDPGRVHELLAPLMKESTPDAV